MSNGSASKTFASSRWMPKSTFIASRASSILHIVSAISPDVSFLPFLLLSFPLIGPLRVFCPLQGLLNDEPVLFSFFPHHLPEPGLRAQSPTFPLSAKEFGPCNCSSPGLFDKFARPQLQRHCQSWPAKRSKSSKKKGVQWLRVSP